MSTIDSPTVMGTFHDRVQAEQAIADLKQAGFSDELIGLAGQDEALEKADTGDTSRKEPSIPDLIVVAVKAEERRQEVLDILYRHGVSEVHDSPFEQTNEHTMPIVAEGYGLQRDPALDTDVPTNNPDVVSNAIAQEEGHDTFFGQTVLPANAQPGSRDDPNLKRPRTV
jgi:hypothetical protein